MSSGHDIDTYSKLAMGASYYLEEAFHHIHSALSFELAAFLFSVELDKIDPTKNDRELIEQLDLSEDPVELLQQDIKDVLTENTTERIALAWQKSLKISRNLNHKFKKNHRIDSISILGHLNNFGFFVETLVNRHLLFLLHTKQLDNFSYQRISMAKILEKIVYIFKEKLNSGDMQISEIKNLFSLRNKTVHYTPNNARDLKPRISELIQIWKGVVALLQNLETKENFSEDLFSKRLEREIFEFNTRWS